jgi:hypothetical protein
MYSFKGINHNETKDFIETKEEVSREEDIVSTPSPSKISIFAISKKPVPIVIINEPNEEQIRTGHRICCD